MNEPTSLGHELLSYVLPVVVSVLGSALVWLIKQAGSWLRAEAGPPMRPAKKLAEPI